MTDWEDVSLMSPAPWRHNLNEVGKRKRNYRSSSEGFIDVFTPLDADHNGLTIKPSTATGARTSLWAPPLRRFSRVYGNQDHYRAEEPRQSLPQPSEVGYQRPIILLSERKRGPHRWPESTNHRSVPKLQRGRRS
jgi:hypothetical protein